MNCLKVKDINKLDFSFPKSYFNYNQKGKNFVLEF